MKEGPERVERVEGDAFGGGAVEVQGTGRELCLDNARRVVKAELPTPRFDCGKSGLYRLAVVRDALIVVGCLVVVTGSLCSCRGFVQAAQDGGEGLSPPLDQQAAHGIAVGYAGTDQRGNERSCGALRGVGDPRSTPPCVVCGYCDG